MGQADRMAPLYANQQSFGKRSLKFFANVPLCT